MSRRVIQAAILFVAAFTVASQVFTQQAASTQIVGGRGGDPFSDPDPEPGARVLEVRIRAGNHVDSIEMAYVLPGGRTVSAPRHGGSGGRLSVFRLERGEHLVGISGRYGDYIDSIRIHTNRRVSESFGGRGGNRDFQVEVPRGYQAVGFSGRAGDYVDAIGLIYAPLRQIEQTAIAGGRGGSEFIDRAPPGGADLIEIRIHAGDHVDSIQAVYEGRDGRRLEGERHGGRGGRRSIFRLEPDEHVIGLSGRHGDYVDSIRIHTNRRTSELFGGRGGKRDYSIEVPRGSHAIGFVGRAGDYLDAVGLVYAETGAPSRRVPGRRPELPRRRP